MTPCKTSVKLETSKGWEKNWQHFLEGSGDGNFHYEAPFLRIKIVASVSPTGLRSPFEAKKTVMSTWLNGKSGNGESRLLKRTAGNQVKPSGENSLSSCWLEN